MNEPSGSQAVALLRYGADNELAWTTAISATNVASIHGLAGFLDGSFVVCGVAVGDATFGAGEPNETVVPGSAAT